MVLGWVLLLVFFFFIFLVCGIVLWCGDWGGFVFVVDEGVGVGLVC